MKTIKEAMKYFENKVGKQDSSYYIDRQDIFLQKQNIYSCLSTLGHYKVGNKVTDKMILEQIYKECLEHDIDFGVINFDLCLYGFREEKRMKTKKEAQQIFADYLKRPLEGDRTITPFLFLLTNQIGQLAKKGYFYTQNDYPEQTEVLEWLHKFSLKNDINFEARSKTLYAIADSHSKVDTENNTFAILREELEQSLSVFRENYSITYSENIAVYTLSLKKDLLFIVTLNNDKITVLDTFTNEVYTCYRVSDVQEHIFEITKSKVRMELSK